MASQPACLLQAGRRRPLWRDSTLRKRGDTKNEDLTPSLWGGLWIGVSAADLGDAQVQWRNTQLEPVDLVAGRYTGGVAYFVDSLLLEDDRAIVAADVSVEPLVQSQAVRVGGEYTILFFSLRAGIVVRPDVPASFTVGAGVHTPRIGIDAAWVQNREIEAEGAGHTLVLSASVSF